MTTTPTRLAFRIHLLQPLHTRTGPQTDAITPTDSGLAVCACACVCVECECVCVSAAGNLPPTASTALAQPPTATSLPARSPHRKLLKAHVILVNRLKVLNTSEEVLELCESAEQKQPVGPTG